MQLYQGDLSPFAARVRIQVRAKGIPGVEFTSPPGGTHSTEYLAINPIGKIPALAVDGRVIVESQTICEYLEDRFPTPSLWPDDLLERAAVRMLCRATDLYVCGPLFQTTAHASRKTRDQAFVDARLAELQAGLRHVEALRARSGAAGSRYLVGDRLTLADCALAPTLFFVVEFAARVFARDDLLPESLVAYWQGIGADPHCRLALDEMGAALRAVRGG